MTWFLLGLSLGIVIGVLIDRDTVYRTVQKFGKIKVKKSSNISDLLDVSATKKELRQRKRQIRRENKSKVNFNK